MSMPITHATAVQGSDTHTPSFLGILRSELYKALHLRVTLVGGILAIIPAIITALFLLVSAYISTTLATVPPALKGDEGNFIEQLFERTLSLTRDFSGMLLLVLTVLVVGQEFQHGTIRIILARGVDRVQLLLAKLCAVFGIALGLLAIYLCIDFALTYFAIAHATGGTHIFQQLPSAFGHDMLLYVASIIVNALVTIMLAMTVTIIGRSMTFGMGAALLFFPADNVLVNIMELIGRLTNSDFWMNVTAYQLGPTLNALPVSLLVGEHVTTDGITAVATDGAVPFVFYDGTHAVLVLLAYIVGFAAISVLLLRQRDVQE